MGRTATATMPVFTVTMEGAYFSKDSEGNNEKPYSVKFKVTKKQLEELRVTAFFKHIVAPIIMPRLYKDYQPISANPATFYVVDADCTVPEMLKEEIDLLNYDGLIQYIEDKGHPINTHILKDAEEIRQAIWDYKKDDEGFLKNQTMFEKRRKGMTKIRRDYAELMSESDLLELNGITSQAAHRTAEIRTNKLQQEANRYSDDI